MDYFVPQNNRWHRWFAGVRPVYRYALTVLVCSGFLYGWYTHVYMRLQTRINRYSQDIENSRRQYELMQQVEFETENLKHSVDDLRATVNNFRANHMVGELPMTYMIDVIKGSGLILQACSTVSETDKDWYTKTKLSVSLQGKMSQIISLFDQLEESQRMVHCGQLSILHAHNDLFSFNFVVSFLQIKS